MAFGLTAVGFNPKRLTDIRAELDAEIRAAFGNNTRTDDESVIGVLTGIVAEQLAYAWEEMERAALVAHVLGAAGTYLDDLVGLANIQRLGATYSEATLTLTGTPSTAVPAGSQVRDSSGTVWTTTALATIGGGGTTTVTARPDSTGPIRALAGTLTEIVTPVSGWSSVTNAADATLGRTQESDAALRVRFLGAFRSTNGSSDEAIRAALLRVSGVTEALVISNRSDITDSEGRPPHSVECIVAGGDDQAVADAIWAAIPAGIQPYGTTESDSVTDSAGDTQTVLWTRPSDLNIYFEVHYSVLPSAPADVEALVQAELLAYGASFLIGQDVVPLEFIQRVETTGLRTFELRTGTASSPTAEAEVSVSRRQRADFDSSRIAFVRS